MRKGQLSCNLNLQRIEWIQFWHKESELCITYRPTLYKVSKMQTLIDNNKAQVNITLLIKVNFYSLIIGKTSFNYNRHQIT